MSEIEKMGPTARRLVACKIQRALIDHNVRAGSGLKAELEARVELVWGAYGQVGVRLRDDHGELVAMEDYLTERKLDPRYAHEFEPIPPAGPSRISASNHELLSSNLERIARGEAAVVFDGS